METFLAAALFVAGFFALVKGANVLITGASALAHKLGLSDFIVGLTVVAFGTSLPEMVVNLLANSEGVSDLAIGNIVGSNIANILLILGVSAIITPLTVKRSTVWREVMFSILASLILLVLVSDQLLGTGGFGGLDVIDGIILVTFFGLFLYYTFGHQYHQDSEEAEALEEGKRISMGRAWLMIILGIAGLALGGQWIVSGTTTIAAGLGISEAVIGLTVVAIGTSAPELAASIVAVKTHKVDIAVGNVLGSNLFNTFWVLGLNAIIRPVAFDSTAYIDVIVSVVAALSIFLALQFVGTKRSMGKPGGITFITMYFAYIVYLVLRETVL